MSLLPNTSSYNYLFQVYRAVIVILILGSIEEESSGGAGSDGV